MLQIFQVFFAPWLNWKFYSFKSVDFSVDEGISEVNNPLDKWLKFLNKTPVLVIFVYKQ